MASAWPNAFGTRVHIHSRLNIPAWQTALSEYHNSDVIEFLTFGWPITYHSANNLKASVSNHPSADNCSSVVDEFIDTEIGTEIGHSATAGPFDTKPFSSLHTSPLQTVPKDENKCRVVIDLSFPSGNSVGGILKDSFLDAPFHLTLPGLVNFIRMIVKHGPRCFLFKKDLKQAYRQIPVDPIDYQYLGYNWRRKCYFNLVLPFNLRSATMACQCSTNAVAYIFKLETKCD